MRKVIIKISENGETSIEADGFQGQGCLKTTEPLRKRLLGSKETTSLKPEFHCVSNPERVQVTE